MKYRFCLMMVLTGSVMCGNAHAACVAPSLVSPAGAEIREASPRFEWTPVSDVRHYLVWLESRVPEGRVLLSEEFQTGATFLVPPRPLTTGKATVRLSVTAVCKDNTQASLLARFRIDEDAACRLKAPPTAVLDKGQWMARWDALPSAQRYDIRMHAAADGKPVLALESTGTSTKLGRLESGIGLLSVQPVCKGLAGVSSWVTVRTE